jgi:hypothetical protein
MFNNFYTERIFLTVKAYPTISKKHREASCMAGFTQAGNWIRLYPVPFRDLADEQKFPKYSWIQARIKKSNDFRQESHAVDHASIHVLEHVSTDNSWSQRNALVLPKVVPASHAFREDRDPKVDTLAVIRPSKVIGLQIDKIPDNDFHKQVQTLNAYQQQMDMFETERLKPLELIPYSFRYIFLDDKGAEHRLKIVDWEIYQLYRKYQHQDWERAIRVKYEQQLLQRELHFFIGTTHVWPKSWIIVGVYYPTSTVSQPDMFNSQF